ncbi:MAG: alpha/beta hydrolase, partial [Alphaproteobacteria bacterium]|nr:alpha/beta hydrolase [Alphaproteobacteria bacterium]
FDALVASTRAHPLPAGGRTLGPGEALTGILGPLYARSTWPALATALAAAQRGDGGPLLAQNDAYVMRHPDGTYGNEEVANTAINCLDHPVPPLAQLPALAAQAARSAPYFGPPILWGAVVCDVWPVSATHAPAPLRAPGAPPILVVGSTGDPVTRYQWAVSLAGELGSGVLVTRHGEGHAAYPFSPCVRAGVDAYLVSLTLPAQRDCT